MLRFEAPKHDPSSFKDTKLTPLEGLVLSLKWFYGRATALLYTWAVHETLMTEKQRRETSRPLTQDAFYMLEKSILHSVILELRALHDRNTDSLSSSQICKRLRNPETRTALDEHLSKRPHRGLMQDLHLRGKYVNYIEKYCSLMSAARGASTLNHHPLSAKMQLVHQMSNKAVAHSTLDRYLLSGDDLGDVIIATVTIACAIEAAFGDAAANNDMAVIERSGYNAAADILHVKVDSTPYTVNMIRGFLPMWIKSGAEFPDYPKDFQRAHR